MKHFFLSLAIGFCALTASASAQYNHCGDFNGDSNTTVVDIVAGAQYLFEGGTPPADFDLADFDRCQKYTFRDQAFLLNCTFACEFFNTQCPPVNPPYVAGLDSTVRIVYPEAIPPRQTHYAIDLRHYSPHGMQGYCLPLKLRINGAVPVIDSVVFPLTVQQPPYMMTRSFIDAANGTVTLVALGIQNGSADSYFARIFVTVAFSAVEQPLSIEYVNLTPAQAPVGQEDAITPYAISGSPFEEFSPRLEPTCCLVAGDADDNGIVNVSDVLKYLCFFFGGCFEGLCAEAMDVNHSNTVSISDAVYLIQYIFSHGPVPTCHR